MFGLGQLVVLWGFVELQGLVILVLVEALLVEQQQDHLLALLGFGEELLHGFRGVDLEVGLRLGYAVKLGHCFIAGNEVLTIIINYWASSDVEM